MHVKAQCVALHRRPGNVSHYYHYCCYLFLVLTEVCSICYRITKESLYLGSEVKTQRKAVMDKLPLTRMEDPQLSKPGMGS